jgi:hypothetical protein
VALRRCDGRRAVQRRQQGERFPSHSPPTCPLSPA